MNECRPRVRGMYFSGTGTTQKIVTAVADGISGLLQEAGIDNGVTGDTTTSFVRAEDIDFTPPAARKEKYSFGPDDIIVFGVPTIAGRVPNVLLPFLETIEGGGAMAIPMVLYGNRNFDDSLIELRNILEEDGFHTVAAAAFIGEHSFSKILAAGRPDEEDMEDAARFAEFVEDKISSILTAADKISGTFEDIDLLKEMGVESVRDDFLKRLCPVRVKGKEPLRPYYKPRDRQGNFIDILKVKPKLDEARCTRCGICVKACPMGSIKAEAPGIVDGICIKCCGCEKKCPEGALYFDDPGYLYHKEELEIQYAKRKEPELFI